MSLKNMLIDGDETPITVLPNGTVKRGNSFFETLQAAFDYAQDEMTPLYDLLQEAKLND